MPSANTSEYADYTPAQLESVKSLDKIKDHYELLGVSRNCSKDDLKRAYKQQALKLHPDKNHAPGASEAFKSVNLAFSILSNPSERRRYEESQWEDVKTDQHHNNQQRNGRHDNFAYQPYENHCFDFFYTEKIFDDDFFESFLANQNFKRKYNRAKEKEKATRNNAQQKKQSQPSKKTQKPQPQRQQPPSSKTPCNNNCNNNCSNNNNSSFSENQMKLNSRKTNMNLLLQLSPLLFILILSLFNGFLTHDLPYTFAQNGKFVVKRHTSRLNIPFFTREDFKGNQLKKVEQKIEEEQLQILRSRCMQEKNDPSTTRAILTTRTISTTSATLTTNATLTTCATLTTRTISTTSDTLTTGDVQLWRARMKNDRELFNQAKDKVLPFCSKLQHLVVSY